ncbi:nitrilase-related carbon-nitrogen hydrolase [uncultured Roseobacter sp.]|uniref:nitrilase-related carbon-nitrogen hydrolase n=1 Tax=uncultured Roseobacter sp. TaxID=114847 RepID=UPI002633EC26|nr:nitrilase-related carbon-nitrogen hydrolase [uncultured Roseobacter sp.]
MIIALYQCPEPVSVDAGLSTVETALAEAAQAGAQMLVLPETFLPGYTQVTATPPSGWSEVHGRLTAACQHHGVALTIGLPEYTETGVFNTALVLGSDGRERARYVKRQLFGPEEAAIYTAGRRDVLFDYEETRFGLLICYDVEFPEHVRALARQGAEVILVPTANMMPFTNVNEIMVPSRAAENALTVVYANYCGTSAGLTYTGLSRIIGRDGLVLAGMEQTQGLCAAAVSGPDFDGASIPPATQLRDYQGD